MKDSVADPFGRSIQYLRISVTDRCNLRCLYCMPEHGVPYEKPDEVLSVDEIVRLVSLLSGHGLRKVRLTGGEPLVRGGEVVQLVGQFAANPLLTDIGLTTNAVLLEQYANALRDAGLRRINISLDTLDRERFKTIARFDKYDNAVAGLQAAVDCGFDPIKLNTVVMRGFNSDEICAFAELTLQQPFHVRFLEYMPIGQVTPWEWREKYISSDSILDQLRTSFQLTEIETPASSTARRFQIPGARGYVELISPISHRFCDGCNRLRLTANGYLVPCLSDNFEYDIKSPLRSGATDDQLLACVREAVSHKPRHSDFEGRANRGGSLRIMAQIGG